MRAMVLERPGDPLRLRDLPDPEPGPGEVRIRVAACGVCRTDLHIADGELTEPRLPLVLGHQIAGRVDRAGPNVHGVSVGDRVGVPWLGGSCGRCDDCATGRENLCDAAVFTGYRRDGGFADLAVADHRFVFPIPEGYPDLQAAPLLCAGLIGFRAYRMAGDARRLGFYGFGSAAHVLCQLAVWEGREVHAFTRPGDTAGQEFARSLGAATAAGSDTLPPEPLDAALLFAADGALVPVALRAVRKGGVVVAAGIHMSDIPSFPYSLLWGERVLRSVANLTRHDAESFLALAPRVPIRTEVVPYPLDRAQDALDDLRAGRIRGSAVLRIGGEVDCDSESTFPPRTSTIPA